MVSWFRERLIILLRWSEKYTKTDMVYLAGAGFWSSLNLFIITGLGLLLSIAYANLLSPEVFGTYQFLISLSSLLVAICLTGMNNAVSQSVARGYEGDLRTSVRIQLLWAAVPTVTGLAGALYYQMHGNSALAIGLCVVATLSPIGNVFNTYTAFLQGKRAFKQIFLYVTATNLFYYALIFSTVYFFRDAIALLFVNLAANTLATIHFYFRTLAKYRPSDRTDPQTIPYGIDLSIMNTAGTIVAQLDSVLVFHFLGPAQLAVYSFASLIPERVSSLFKFVSNAALPKFSTQTIDEIRSAIVSKTIRAAIAGSAVMILYLIFAPVLFHTLFPKYAEAIFYSQVYSLVIITVAANIPAAAIVGLRMNRELYLFNLSTPFVLMALQLVLLIKFGILGILLARIISNVINILFAIYLLFHPLPSRA